MTTAQINTDAYRRLGELGTATVHEAAGRTGVLDVDWIQLIPGSSVCGPARIVRCGQDDNTGVHAVMEHVQPGEVLVLTMPEARPVALLGDLLATQAQVRGAVAVLVDASVRDADELRRMGLPIWARWIRVSGANKGDVGELNARVTVGGATIALGDALVLDGDGVVVVPTDRIPEVLAAAEQRAAKEEAVRPRLRAGELSYDIYQLRP